MSPQVMTRKQASYISGVEMLQLLNITTVCLAAAFQCRCNQFCGDITHTPIFKPSQDAVRKVNEGLQYIERKFNEYNEK